MPDEEGHPSVEEIDLGEVLSALADPLRRRVIQELLAGEPGEERTCTSFGLDTSKSTRTHHFRVLREAGLVQQVDRGNSRKVRLRQADLDTRFPGLLGVLNDAAER